MRGGSDGGKDGGDENQRTSRELPFLDLSLLFSDHLIHIEAQYQ